MWRSADSALNAGPLELPPASRGCPTMGSLIPRGVCRCCVWGSETTNYLNAPREGAGSLSYGHVTEGTATEPLRRYVGTKWSPRCIAKSTHDTHDRASTACCSSRVRRHEGCACTHTHVQRRSLGNPGVAGDGSGFGMGRKLPGGCLSFGPTCGHTGHPVLCRKKLTPFHY